MNELQSQNFLLRVDPLSTMYSEQQVDHARWKTWNISQLNFFLKIVWLQLSEYVDI